ncbi:MAG: hypothetical protein ACI93S_001355 [Ancylomarina sp.]|jgi:hypothetical protein
MTFSSKYYDKTNLYKVKVTIVTRHFGYEITINFTLFIRVFETSII